MNDDTVQKDLTMTSRHKSDWPLIVGALLVWLVFIADCSPSASDGCYDADPTQWTEMVCPGEYNL